MQREREKYNFQKYDLGLKREGGGRVGKGGIRVEEGRGSMV